MRRFLLILIILALAAGALWYFVLLPKQQAAAPGTTGSFRSFFSLGNESLNTLPENQTAETTSEESAAPSESTGQRLTQISVGPVAGFTTYTVTKTTTIPAANSLQKPVVQKVFMNIVRYVSRANGYVYEVTDGGVANQITNIFIPNIYEASFADGNKTALLRFLRDDNRTIATYSVPIPEENPDGTRTQRDGVYLPDNIQSLAVSPDQKIIARLTTDPSIAVVTTSTSTGTGIKESVRSPFHEWLVSWSNVHYLQTKASAGANGFFYRVDPVQKRLVRVLGNIPGLTASASPKGTYVLYSETVPNSFVTRLLVAKTGTVKNLNVSILPEKCVWLANEDAICAGNDVVPSGTYPDDWYKGLTTFSDKLYRIYTAQGIIDEIGDGVSYPHDMTALSYNENQNALYFIDKKTGVLWQYQL